MKAPKTLSNLLGNLRAPAKGKIEAIVLTDPGLSAIAARWRTAAAEETNAKSGKELARAEMIEPLRRAWFAKNEGSATPVNSIQIPSEAGPILASFSSTWDIPDPESEAAVMARIPESMRREAYTLKIDIDELPVENQYAFAKGVLALATKFGNPGAVRIGGGVRPVPTFNAQRHAAFTAAENAILESLGLHTRMMLRAQ